jgi:hypothetical protein
MNTVYVVIVRYQLVRPGLTENPALPVAVLDRPESIERAVLADLHRREQEADLNGHVVHDVWRVTIGGTEEPVLVVQLAGGLTVFREGDVPSECQLNVTPRPPRPVVRHPDGSGSW